MVANVVVAVPLLIVSVVRLWGSPWLVPVAAAVVVTCAAIVVLYFRNARFEYGGGAYRRVSWLGASRSFSSAAIGAVVEVPRLTWGLTPAARMLGILDHDGRRLFRAVTTTWRDSDLEAVTADLTANGAVVDRVGISDPAELRTRYPRLIAGWEAHPVAAGIVLAVIILVAVTVAVVVYQVASGSF